MSRSARSSLTWIAIICAAGFGALTTIVATSPTWLTQWDADVVSRWQGSGPTDLLEWVSRAGTTTVILPALALAIVLLWRRVPRLAIAYVGLLATSAVLIRAFKDLLDRPRPEGSLVEADLASYPSGHAVLVVILAVLVISTTTEMAGRRRWLSVSVGVAMTAIVLVTCAGRVLLGVHWLSDVAGGALLGGALCATALAWARLAPLPEQSPVEPTRPR